MTVRSVILTGLILTILLVGGGCQDLGTAPFPHSILSTAGNNQTGKAGQPLAPLVVTVLHQGLDALGGVRVQFSIIEVPADAIVQTLPESSVLTDPQGRASTVFTLGSKLGIYRVKAEVVSNPGVATVFTLEATEEDAPPEPEISFRSDVLPIFQRHGCLSCHGGTNNLFVGTVPQLLAGGLNGPAVTPGNANESLIIRKTSTTPPFGDRMPQGGPYLPDSTTQVLRTWINQGAKDN